MKQSFSSLYDIKKSYLENAEEGPFFEQSIPKRVIPPQKMWHDFLGYRVASKIGVPAGPLLNARWVAFAAQMGFDIVTYKTIRSAFHPSHPVPNMIFVNAPELQASEEGGIVYQRKGEPSHLSELALTNSFGIPSRDKDYLLKDIKRAKESLKEGQVMIVSFVGTPREGEDFVEDFVKAASIAKEGGASIFEADFSCPNVKGKEGSIHKNAEAVFLISKAIKKAFKEPLIIKLGVIHEEECLESVMKMAAKAKVDAICGINTMSMRVLNAENKAALGENRLRAGVCGAPIRKTALEFVEKAAKINRKHQLGLTIMGTGGVVEPYHFDLFFEKGADVAMTGVGMLYDPYLAIKYHGK